jgi:ketosteroid isomerase-like protein
MVKREDVQAVIDGILSGKMLEVFESYYHDDVVMSENGAQERVGKDANRKYEEQFVNNVEFHGAEAVTVLIDGDHAAIEWVFDMTPANGSRVQQRQVALQRWRDGKVVREVFYHG